MSRPEDFAPTRIPDESTYPSNVLSSKIIREVSTKPMNGNGSGTSHGVAILMSPHPAAAHTLFYYSSASFYQDAAHSHNYEKAYLPAEQTHMIPNIKAMYPSELYVNFASDQSPLSKQQYREVCGTKVRCTGMQIKIINEGRNVDLSGDVMVQQIPMAAADAVSTVHPPTPGTTPAVDWVTNALNLDHLYNVKGSCDTELNIQASEGKVFDISTDKEIGAVWAPEGIPKYNKLAVQKHYEQTEGGVLRNYDLAKWNSFAASNYYSESHITPPQPLKDKQPAVLVRIRNCQTAASAATGPTFLLEMTWHWEIISAAPMKMFAQPASVPWNHAQCQHALNHLRTMQLSWQGKSNAQGHNTRCGLGADYVMPTFPGAVSPSGTPAMLREAIRLKGAHGESEMIRQMHKVLLEHHDKAVLATGDDAAKHVHKLHNVIKQMEKHQDVKLLKHAYEHHHGWLHTTKEGRERRAAAAKAADAMLEEAIPSKGGRDLFEHIAPLERVESGLDAARDFVGGA